MFIADEAGRAQDDPPSHRGGTISFGEAMSDHWINTDIAHDPRHHLLTPRIALSHQTGFPNWRTEAANGRLAFTVDPGTQFTYSGEGFNYVARFVEKKLGETFESIAQKLVFDPIGMANTSFSSRTWMAGRNPIPATESGRFGRAEIPATGTWDAANNLSTTIEDYARFVLSVMKDEMMTPELARERLRLYRSTAEKAPCRVEPRTLKSRPL